MLEILTTAAQLAGQVLLSYFRTGIATTAKSSNQDIVTAADLASQKLIVETITKHMLAKGFRDQDIGFIGEENLHKPGSYTFIIDPLDGTTNFASGLSTFGVAIAGLHKGKPVASVVYLPMGETMFTAEMGKGAWIVRGKKKEKLVVTPKPLQECLLLGYISSRAQKREQWFDVIGRIYTHVRGVRILGAATGDLMAVADNAANIVLYAKTGLWDIAAAHLILAESGGTIVDWKGNPLVYDLDYPTNPYQILACHPSLIPEIVPHLS